MTENRLTGETSPYLLQHKDNPVHWQPWGADALASARDQGKPILLSIGYAACHWCHVMAHESFENSDIAAVMNEHFVNIKVDREERPDIDAVYQSALSMMGEQGGWPLTMFLTPDGEPFWGGTYFPAMARYGRPSFPDLLRGITDTFRNRRESVDANVTTLRDGLSKVFKPENGGELCLETLDQIAAKLVRAVDPIHGGTQGAPKFPQPSIFQFLWRAYKRTRSPTIKEAVTVTLDNICQGGIYDHLGGGFARYATDDTWLVPHFEKMLYDNALLIELLTEVWLETRAALYETRLRETISWALREMRSGSNADYAFVSAFDADSEGVEGKFYVWREDEIDAAPGIDAASFKTVYDVTPHGNWEGNNILNRSHDLEFGSPEDEQRLEDARRVLFDIRARRIPPQRDDKVLADWNGLMIAALARAATAFNEPAWLAAAETAFRFVATKMTASERLLHSWCEGRANHPAVIEDYANMSRAALVLHEATCDPAYLDQARTWTEIASDHYWDSA
ncbi:MAG: thioredoxin domain-containing protein, partial [Rhodospirillales bacterium]